MLDVLTGFWVCQDCLMFIANGELPEDGGEAIVEGCERELPYQWVADSPAEGESEDACTREFSWRSCHCCNSKLGGSRHRCVLIGKV
jgi:hypothetical protein